MGRRRGRLNVLWQQFCLVSTSVIVAPRVWHRHGAIAAAVVLAAYATTATLIWLPRREEVGPNRKRAMDCVVIGPLVFGLVASFAPATTLACVAVAAVEDNARGDLRSDQRIELPAPRRLGAYRVVEAYQLGDGVFVVVDGGGGLMSVEGFARPPPAPIRYWKRSTRE